MGMVNYELVNPDQPQATITRYILKKDFDSDPLPLEVYAGPLLLC